MSTAVAKREVAEIVETIDRPEFQRQLAEALPPGLSVARFTRTTKLAIQLNPDIIEVDRQSLFLAMVRCAKDGLLPDGREAALVKVKVKGEDTAAYWPMVGGLRKIAAKHGWRIEAHAVHSNDLFEYRLGYAASIVHEPAGLSEEPGDLIGAYAVATGPTGEQVVEVMRRAEVEEIRATSRAASSEYGPWVKWPAEMYRKTVARRLFKQLPLGDLSEVDERVLHADEADVTEATAVVPALANLPDVETIEEPEVVEVGEVVE